MEQQQLLIERVRRALPTRSNYAVAKALETTQTDLSRVLKGKHGLGIKSIVRVSEILQVPLRDVLALCQEDVAKRPKDKEFWGRRSPRITASSALAIVALGLAGTIKTGNVQGEELLYRNTVDSYQFIHYAKCTP